ncbi:MAG: hypothetical protein GY861_04855 [bacterium]|nr:hypothetical protein [bacterium]
MTLESDDYFTYNLDNIEELFFEMENIQDGPHGHRCTIKAENDKTAARILCDRLVGFFEKNMAQTDSDGIEL